MRYLVGFGRFWYDFIVGDDWRIAAGVTLVLALGAVVEAAGLGGEWLAPVLAVGLGAVFVATLLLAVRPPRVATEGDRTLTHATPRTDSDLA